MSRDEFCLRQHIKSSTSFFDAHNIINILYHIFCFSYVVFWCFILTNRILYSAQWEPFKFVKGQIWMKPVQYITLFWLKKLNYQPLHESCMEVLALLQWLMHTPYSAVAKVWLCLLICRFDKFYEKWLFCAC